jgi:hypothetical protein
MINTQAGSFAFIAGAPSLCAPSLPGRGDATPPPSPSRRRHRKGACLATPQRAHLCGTHCGAQRASRFISVRSRHDQQRTTLATPLVRRRGHRRYVGCAPQARAGASGLGVGKCPLGTVSWSILAPIWTRNPIPWSRIRTIEGK